MSKCSNVEHKTLEDLTILINPTKLYIVNPPHEQKNLRVWKYKMNRNVLFALSKNKNKLL